jgi:hypothetical protein
MLAPGRAVEAFYALKTYRWLLNHWMWQEIWGKPAVRKLFTVKLRKRRAYVLAIKKVRPVCANTCSRRAYHICMYVCNLYLHIYIYTSIYLFVFFVFAVGAPTFYRAPHIS